MSQQVGQRQQLSTHFASRPDNRHWLNTDWQFAPMLRTEFVHVGYGGTIAVNRVIAIASPDSAPIKRMVRVATRENRIINLTYGRKAKCVIVLDSGHIVLAAFQPNIILRRINDYRARGTNLLDLALDGEQGETINEEKPIERD